MKNLDLLESLLEDIKFHLSLLEKDLPKGTTVTAASRRLRIRSVLLEKLFKRYRKVSCEYGLK